jgi:hypothetical protein
MTAALAVTSFACSSSQGSDRAEFPTQVSLQPAATGESQAPQTPGAPIFGDGFVEYPDIPILNVSTRDWEDTNLRRYAAEVDPSDFVHGGVGRNDIAPIYSPKFVPLGVAVLFDWMTADHPMVVLEIDGDARAYPMAMLTIHEIVNDTVAGEPIVVTYCPLCYTALAFKRTVDGRSLVFGSTGTLRHSNQLMWDDATDSWWQQVTGQAVVGDMAGTTLESVPVFITSFAEFVRTYPSGTVMSPESMPSEFHGGYGFTAYLNYDWPNLFYGELDQRLDPIERVLGVEAGGVSMAFPFKVLSDARVTETTVGDQDVVVFWRSGMLSPLDQEVIAESRDIGSAAAFDPELPDGRVLTFTSDASGGFVDDQTGSEWTLLGRARSGELAGTQLDPLHAENGMWFVWKVFRPDTLIYESEQVS